MGTFDARLKTGLRVGHDAVLMSGVEDDLRNMGRANLGCVVYPFLGII
jgi:hypothetical protein